MGKKQNTNRCYEMPNGEVIQRQPFNTEAWEGRFVKIPTNTETTMVLANWGEVVKQMPEGNQLVDVRLVSADCLYLNGKDVREHQKLFETAAISLAPKLIRIFQQAEQENRKEVAVNIRKYEEKGRTRLDVA